MSKYFFRNIILFHVKQNDLWIKSVFKKVGYLVSRGTYFFINDKYFNSERLFFNFKQTNGSFNLY